MGSSAYHAARTLPLCLPCVAAGATRYTTWQTTRPAPESPVHACVRSNKASYKRDGDDFQLRFSQKFDGADEMFFAFAIPYSYRDTQVQLPTPLCC